MPYADIKDKREHDRKYAKTLIAKATFARYKKSEKGKLTQKRYAATFHGRETIRRAGRQNSRARKLKQRFNLSIVEWETMFATQEFRCAACKSSYCGQKSGKWHTDHNHETGKVRGILCHGCNISLGLLKDDPLRLRLLAEYVEKEGQEVARA